jgi:hypothetical protein
MNLLMIRNWWAKLIVSAVIGMLVFAIFNVSETGQFQTCFNECQLVNPDIPYAYSCGCEMSIDPRVKLLKLLGFLAVPGVVYYGLVVMEKMTDRNV